MENRSNKASANDNAYYVFGLRIIGEIGGIIAIPVVVLSVIGKGLDQRYGTWPILTIIAFTVAAGVSFLLVRRSTMRISREYQQLIDSEKKQ